MYLNVQYLLSNMQVKETENVMLAQPYNPHLFRQGLLPGPQLLQDVLTERLGNAAAKAAWKRHESAQKHKAQDHTNGWKHFTLPCHGCTDNNGGTEVWLPIARFAGPVLLLDKPRFSQEVLSKGQDLCCLKCLHQITKYIVTLAIQ